MQNMSDVLMSPSQHNGSNVFETLKSYLQEKSKKRSGYLILFISALTLFEMVLNFFTELNFVGFF